MDFTEKEILGCFLNFQIVYNIKEKSNTFVQIGKHLGNLSNLTIKGWNLNIEKGRIQLFQLFDKLEPHFSLTNDRFELFVSEQRIKINFPDEDFFYLKGPKGYYRIRGFPSEEDFKSTSVKELNEIQNLINLIILSKFGLNISKDLDHIEIYFIIKIPDDFSFKKLEKNLNGKFKFKIESIDLSIEDTNKDQYSVEIISKKKIKGKFEFSEFNFNTPIYEILEKTIKKIYEIKEELGIVKS